MKTTKLGIAVMALMGAFAQKADPKKTTFKITAPKPEPKRNVPSSGKKLRSAAMPEYYGFRKRPCEAINKRGERVDISVKNALKKGMKIVNIPNVDLNS